MICPLTDEQTSKALEEPLKQLISKCREAKCFFVDSDHDTDYLPSNCVLIVVAMLSCKRK